MGISFSLSRARWIPTKQFRSAKPLQVHRLQIYILVRRSLMKDLNKLGSEFRADQGRQLKLFKVRRIQKTANLLLEEERTEIFTIK